MARSVLPRRAWHRAHSDWFVTPNQATADVMIRQGVPAAKVLPYGFPVSSRLAPRSSAKVGERPRVLVMLNPGKRDAVELASAARPARAMRDADFSGNFDGM